MKAKTLHLAPMESGRVEKKEKPELTPDYLSRCAFAFAYALLWDGEPVSTKDKKESIALLNKFFQSFERPRRGLLILCERIQLEAMRYRIPILGSVHAQEPAGWMEETLAQNGTLLSEWYERLLQARMNTFMHRKDECQLALQYLSYVMNPTARTFRRGRRRLFSARAYKSIGNYYHVVLFYNYMIG